MTLLQEKAVSLLPKNNFNVSKSMQEAGYSFASSQSGNNIANVRNCAKKKYFDEELIRKEYKKTLKQTEKAEDLTNKLRTLEGMTKLEGLDRRISIGSVNVWNVETYNAIQDIDTLTKLAKNRNR